MLAAVAAAVAKKAVGLGCSAVQKKIEQWKDFNGDVEDIKADLLMIVAAEEDQILRKGDPSKVKIQSTEELRDLAQKIEYCFDGILRFAKSSHPQQFLKVSSHRGSHPFARRVKNLRKRLRAARDRAVDYNVNGGEPSTKATRLSVDDDFPRCAGIQKPLVDIETPKDEILELLGDINSQTEQLTVICIVGFGGSGKSTLADAVYQNFLEENAVYQNESTRRPSWWINARKHKDDIKELLKSILDQIVLRQEIERYLIVLDNIEDQQWQKISSTFSENSRGIIIVTTTTHSLANNICSRYGNGHVYNMRTLEDRHSYKLLEHVLEKRNPSMFEDCFHLIINKCDGHPLALYSMAQYLLGETQFTEEDFCTFWDSLCDKMKDCAQFRDLEQILMNSYSELPGYPLNVRACLLYICAFPGGHQIRRNRLIRRWLAEGYSRKEANESFKKLVDQNFFRANGSSKSFEMKTCIAHGIIHGFMTHMSRCTRFMQSANNSERRNYRHLYRNDGELLDMCQPQSSKDNNTGKESSNQEFHAHSLTICGRAGKKVIGDLPKCKVVRVLDLEECDDLENQDIEDIDKLWHLKYLSLGPNIDKLPEKIYMLHCLETLDLRKTKIDTIPVVVIMLPHLSHLLGKFKLEKMAEKSNVVDTFSQQKSNMETLAGFVTDGNPGFPKLMVHMKKLRKVKIWCDSTHKHSVGFNDLLKAIKMFVEAIWKGDHSLSLYLGDSSKEIISSLWNDREMVTGYLSSLKLDGALSGLTQFATLLTGLKELCLSSTNGLTTTELAKLHKIHLLKYLKLVNVNLARFLIRSEHFRKLLCLCLVQCPNLPRIEAGALPGLHSLWILNKDQDDLSYINIEQHKHLKEVALDSRVKRATITSWEEAAKKHPKRPKILFFKYVSSNGTGSMVKYVATERPDEGVQSSSVDQLQPSWSYRYPPTSTKPYDAMEIDVASSSSVMT